jgi:RNA polymerase sigma-70 factor (ECF subfamily)
MSDGIARSAGNGQGGSRSVLTPAAFAVQFEGSWRKLWCIGAAVVGDRAQADDVLQEAAMIALGKLSQFDPHTSFAAWMAQIVRYVALNHARRRHRNSAAPLEPHTIAARSEAPEAELVSKRGTLRVDQSEFDDHVLAGLRSLDETPRACLLMRVLLDMPYREIATSLEIPEGTAMSHVHRARTHLRELLSGSTGAQGRLSATKHE